MPHPVPVVMLAPLVLVGPLLLLAEAVLALLRLGPLGWPLAAALLYAVWWSSRWAWNRSRTWWAGTKAPGRTASAPVRPRPAPPRHHLPRGR